MPYVRKSAKPAKPKKPAVLATASPPARAAKEKGRTTISTTTVPKPRAPRASATVHTGPGPSPPSVSRSRFPSVSRSRSTESALDGESSDVDELSNNCGTLMKDIHEMIQGSKTEALAVRDGKKKGGNFATGLPTAPVDRGCPAGTAMPQHVLSRWHWVSEDMIKFISFENFDIENLLKFHRFDELRNAYLKRSMKDIYQSLNDDSAEIIIDTSKLHFSFRNPMIFFLAWQIYISIQAKFKLEMSIHLVY